MRRGGSPVMNRFEQASDLPSWHPSALRETQSIQFHWLPEDELIASFFFLSIYASDGENQNNSFRWQKTQQACVRTLPFTQHGLHWVDQLSAQMNRLRFDTDWVDLWVKWKEFILSLFVLVLWLERWKAALQQMRRVAWPWGGATKLWIQYHSIPTVN